MPAASNHLGIRTTTRLTCAQGWLIFVVSSALMVALLASAQALDPLLLVTPINFTGLPPEAPIWPATTPGWPRSMT